MANAIEGDGNHARFSLCREPNGVYRVDGRAIPASDDATRGIDDGKLVGRVHSLQHSGIGLLGSEARVNVEK